MTDSMAVYPSFTSLQLRCASFSSIFFCASCFVLLTYKPFVDTSNPIQVGGRGGCFLVQARPVSIYQRSKPVPVHDLAQVAEDPTRPHA